MTQIITTHKNTDFDAFASVIAASLLYPDAIPVLPKTLNPNVKAFLSIHKDLLGLPVALPDPDKVKRLIVVDTSSWSRLENMDALKKRDDLEIIIWDHHPEKGDIKADVIYCEEIGANITLLSEQLKKEKKIITPIQSTLFLTGLYEDTGNLTFTSSTSRDAHAAAYLLERKADLGLLNKFLRPGYGEKQKNVLFKMLENTSRMKLNGHSISISTVQIKGHVDSLALVLKMYRDIVNVDAAFGIFVSKGKKKDLCMVIGRSDAEGLNIGTIMKSMGGGGHPGAGSAILKSVNPKVIEQMIQNLIRGNQQASVQISDLMSFPVFSVPSETSMAQVAGILREKGCTGLPVVDDQTLVGVISRRDFTKIRKDAQLKAPVKAFMNRNIKTIEPGKSPIQAAKIMVKHDIGRLPVVDNGKIIGIITRSDTMLYFYDLLPD